MTMITRQNLMAEKTRFAISVGGIALAVLLMSFLLSLYQGWRLNVGRFVEHVNADIWVAREGTTDFLNAASILPADTQQQLAQEPGVERVDAVVVRPMDFTISGKTQSTHLVGYETDGGAAGPPQVTSGKAVPGPDEVIVDEAFADKAGLHLGDTFQVGGRQLTVVGTSTGGNLIFSQTTFVSLDTARAVLNYTPGLSTFYLLHLTPGTNATETAARIQRDMPGVSAFTKAQFAAATRDRVMKNILPILFVIIALAFVVGVAITGLTIYNATVEKAREFGILKAIGFTNGYLFRLVLEQSMATGILGFVIGAVLTVIGTQFIGDLVPAFITQLRWQDVVFVLIATLLMSGCAALLPVRRIANVDPVAVFNR
jgi:putative ABC transport system permease protein